MIKNDMKARIDLPNADSDEYKFLTNNGWKVRLEELICTENEIYEFLDKNGPSDFETIKAAFPKHSSSELTHTIGVLVYSAKTVDTMNGINGMSGVFVTARHQKNWANKIQKKRNDNKPVSMCDLPCPDVDPISTNNKTKISDIVNSTISSDKSETPEAEPESTPDIKASINLPKIVQKTLRKSIIENATSLINFNSYISNLSPEHQCYWNEYLDDFKRKLILTEIKKKLTPK